MNDGPMVSSQSYDLAVWGVALGWLVCVGIALIRIRMQSRRRRREVEKLLGRKL